jgi:hypothetical protein
MAPAGCYVNPRTQNLKDFKIDSRLFYRGIKNKGLGKITSLLSANFRPIFIAINRKTAETRSLHYTFNGTLIKIMLISLIGKR